jgi:hypothetical protein
MGRPQVCVNRENVPLSKADIHAPLWRLLPVSLSVSAMPVALPFAQPSRPALPCLYAIPFTLYHFISWGLSPLRRLKDAAR